MQTAPEPVKPPAPTATATESVWTWVLRVLSIALAIGSWGAYGPVLHKGQAAMQHSRLRPLICVGIAYFVIAVIVPYFFLGEMGEASTYRSMGTFWALLGGIFRRRRCAGHHLGIQLGREAGVCHAAGVRRCAGDQYARGDFVDAPVV